MSDVWFTADTHFGHYNLIAHGMRRGFETIASHDECVITWWNETVRPQDQVWHLGDWGLGSKERYLEIVGELNGEIHLVPGNHDPVHPSFRDSHKHLSRWYGAGFASIQAYARRSVAGQRVLLSHLPYAAAPSAIEPPTPEPVPMDETWIETEYSGYHVNAAGQVRGRFGRALTPWLAGSGKSYLYVSISGIGNRTVHSLVCTAFHGPRPPGKQAAHQDGNSMNNRADNLRWSTPKENAADKIRHGTVAHVGPRGEANSHAVLTEELVTEIRAAEGSYAELAALYGVSKATIADIVKWRTWKDAPRRYWITNDHTGTDRASQYRLPNEGLVLLHGHVHGEWAERDRMINVGVDVRDFRPVHLDRIAELVKELP